MKTDAQTVLEALKELATNHGFYTEERFSRVIEALPAAQRLVEREKPDQWYCDIDADERGDTPYEALYPYRPRLEPVKIHGIIYGPTKWAVMADHPTEDGEECFVFDTEEEAQQFCDEQERKPTPPTTREA